MASRLTYSAIERIPRAHADEAAATDSPDLPLVAIAVGLHEPDLAWAQSYLLGLAGHRDAHVRGNAILALGHLARIHRRLDVAIVKPAVMQALLDPDPYVRGHADSALSDIETFLGRG